MRRLPGTRVKIAATAVVAALVSGCDQVSSNPLTPEESRAQVVEAYFRHGSCTDDNKGPFRGTVSITYPHAPSMAESEAEIAQMAQRLKDSGWTDDSEFRSQGTVLKENNVVVVFDPQNVSMPNRGIDLYGACRDVTTTKDHNTGIEPLTPE